MVVGAEIDTGQPSNVWTIHFLVDAKTVPWEPSLEHGRLGASLVVGGRLPKFCGAKIEKKKPEKDFRGGGAGASTILRASSRTIWRGEKSLNKNFEAPLHYRKDRGLRTG